MKKVLFTVVMSLALVQGAFSQVSSRARSLAGHSRVVNGLLELNGQRNVAMKTTGMVQRVIAQSTRDNALGSLSDSVDLGYTGMRGAKYDYNTMIYAYNYPYSTTPMFNYAGVFTTPQVAYDTYMHWTINPFTMPAYGMYEFSYAGYDANSNLTSFKELFVDSVTNDNRSYTNIFNTANKIKNGFWFNLNAGVADSAFKQNFTYNTSGKLTSDTVYELHLGVWRLAAHTTYTYDGSGNLTLIDHFANEDDTSFLLPLIQQSKYVNTYDGSNRLLTVYTHLYDGTSLSPYVKDTFAYTGTYAFHTSWRQHQFDEIHATWWPQYYMSKHLNSLGQPDTVYHKGWDSIASAWTPNAMDVISYNSYNNPDQLKNYLYNWTSYSSTPDYTTTYYYELYLDATGTKEKALASDLLSVYPDPVSGTLTVSLQGAAGSQPGVLSVIDIQGRLMSRRSVNNCQQLQLPVDDLAPGVYWLMLQQANGTVFHQRFVKE